MLTLEKAKQLQIAAVEVAAKLNELTTEGTRLGMKFELDIVERHVLEHDRAIPHVTVRSFVNPSKLGD